MGVLSKPSRAVLRSLKYILKSPKRAGSLLGVLVLVIAMYNRRNKRLRDDLLKKSPSFSNLGARKRKKIGKRHANP